MVYLTRLITFLALLAAVAVCLCQTQTQEQAKPGITVSTPIYVADSLADAIDQKLQTMGWTVPDDFRAQGVLAVDYFKFHFVVLIDTSQVQASGLFGEHAYEVPRIFLHQRRKFQDGKDVRADERHLVSYLTYQLDAYLPQSGQAEGSLGSPKVLWPLDGQSFQQFRPERRQIPLRSDGATPYRGGKDHQAGRLEALRYLLSQNSTDPIVLIQMSASPVSNNTATKNREPGQLGGLGDSGLSFIDVFPTSLGNQRETYNIWVFAEQKPAGVIGRTIDITPPVDVKGQTPEPDRNDNTTTGGDTTGGTEGKTTGGDVPPPNPCESNPSLPQCQPFNWTPIIIGAIALLAIAVIIILLLTVVNRRRSVSVGGSQFVLQGLEKKSLTVAGDDPVEADNILLLRNDLKGTLDAVTLGTFSIDPISGKVNLRCAAGITMNSTTDLNVTRLAMAPGQQETVQFMMDLDSSESSDVDLEVTG